MAETKHLVFVPAPSAGHLHSTLRFAQNLIQTSSSSSSNSLITITVLILSLPSFPVPPLPSLTGIRFHHLPALPPPADAEFPEEFASLFFQAQNPSIKAFISSSSTPVSALFIDLFATSAIDVADELGIPTYVFFSTNALFLGLMMHLPTLEDERQGCKEALRLPGIDAIPAEWLPQPLWEKEEKGRNYEWYVRHGRRFREVKGIALNTFQELETGMLRLLAEGRMIKNCPTPALYPIGPVLSLQDADEISECDRHECLRWLDEQPTGSVAFLCFGSMGSFGAEQIKEIAAALLQSDHRRFLWIVRSPPSTNSIKLSDANLSQVLPPNFLDATRARGLVWPSWAPQTKILAHPSLGGFVTHCGWNSALESLWFGVPMLAWPLYAEQHLNAFQMVRDLGIAAELEVDRKNGNFVKAEELERGLGCLMGESEEGKKVREKVEEIKWASRKTIEEGGSSYNYLQKLVEELVA